MPLGFKRSKMFFMVFIFIQRIYHPLYTQKFYPKNLSTIHFAPQSIVN